MECIQLSLSGKMFPELSAQTAEKISEPCWKNLPTRHNQTFQFLDLRGGDDGARPEQSSETAGLWHGGCSTLNVGECPSVESVSQLSQILEVNAVIREELDELIDEVRKLHFGLTIRLWRDVKRNEPMKREHLNLIYDVAIHAAVEAIQLAAMVKKYERSQRHDWPGGWVPDYGTGPEPLKKKGVETV